MAMIHEHGASAVVEWVVAGRPIAGASVCGDHFVVAPYSGGVVLGVIDGLGHGPEAAEASHAAAALIAARAGPSLEALVMICHEALHGSRGVVLTLARINAAADELAWLGVGNVEAVLYSCRGKAEAVPRGGVVGYRLPTLRPASLPIARGDVLVFASDGLTFNFPREFPSDPLGSFAATLVERHGKQTDDVMVLAARYLGMPP
jgi:phosphoserine phosphatase RsbX